MARVRSTTTGHLQVIGESGRRRWRIFWEDADGKHTRVLGQAWVKPSGKRTARGAIVWRVADGPKPDPSYLTPKEAEAELRRVLEHEAVKKPSAKVRDSSVLTFADAAEAWLNNGERKRNLKLSTLKDYRQALDAYLLPAKDPDSRITSPYGRASFGGMPLTRIKTRVIREWFDALPYGRTSEKLLTMVGAVFAYAKGEGWIDDDPTAAIRQKPVTYSGEYDFYSTDEVRELVAAADTEQDAAVYLTAAMTGLRRGELMALSWRDVDFKGQAIQVRANYSFGQLVAPKSGKVRTVPMVPEVSDALKALSQRPMLDGPTDPVFMSATGGRLDGAVLRRRYVNAVKGAGLRHLPFHSLRHHFGSMAVNRASLVQVQTWMGHSHIQTTARYLHAKSRADDAALLAQAFSDQFVDDLPGGTRGVSRAVRPLVSPAHQQQAATGVGGLHTGRAALSASFGANASGVERCSAQRRGRENGMTGHSAAVKVGPAACPSGTADAARLTSAPRPVFRQ